MTEVKRRKRARDEGDVTFRGGGDEQGEEGGGQARGNQSLPVAILPLGFKGIPEDGAQYLAVVRRQAHASPSVVRVERPDHIGPNADAIAVEVDCVDDVATPLLPSLLWRTTFLQRFRNMRSSLQDRRAPDGGTQIGVPSGRNARKWFSYLHGHGPMVAGAETVEAGARASLRPPSVALLQHLQTTQILALLSAITVWLEEDWRLGLDDEATSATAVHPFHSQWLFSALAHLEERLVGDDVSTLRSLARACVERIRHARSLQRGESDFSNESGAWLVVCAIAGVWGQHDLWQDAESRLRTLQQHVDLC